MSESPSFKRVETKPEGYNSKDPWTCNLVPERKVLAETLTRRFMGSSSPFVVSINSGLGTGKSLFLTMWKDWLTYGEDIGENGKTPKPCLYFNAWENDADDPLVGFMGVLSTSMSEKNSFFVRQQKTVRKLIVKCGKFFAKSAGAVANFAGQQYGSSEVGGVAGAIAEGVAEEVIDCLIERDKSREGFKKELSQFATRAKKNTSCPLIVMVDELDRCKPTYAVALLERIKHLFDVDNVVFVLTIERQQLCNCIKAVYGLDDPGAFEYLGKLIDLQLDLPQMDNQNIIDSCIASGKYPIGCDYPAEFKENGFPSLLEWIGVIVYREKKLSARQIQQVFHHISIISYAKDIKFIDVLTCTILVSLFFTNEKLDNAFRKYEEYVDKCSGAEFFNINNNTINYFNVFLILSITSCKLQNISRPINIFISNTEDLVKEVNFRMHPALGKPMRIIRERLEKYRKINRANYRDDMRLFINIASV